MKDSFLTYFKIVFTFSLLCSNSLWAQTELRIFVSSLDSIRVKHAEIWLNDVLIPYNGIREAYVKPGYIYRKKDTLHIKIYHHDYLPRILSVTGESINEAKHSYNTTIYLFTKNQHCYICGRDSVPFDYLPKSICVYFKEINHDDVEINHLLRKLKLRKVNEEDKGFILLKKKNGGKFKDFNCKELKALRESKLVLGAGPVIGEGYFTNLVYIESNKNDKAKEIMKNSGFDFIRFEPYSSTMCFMYKENSIGYGLIDITNKLLQYPEIKSIRLDIHAPRIYY